MLDGVTVLDLSSVGPATRAAAILADYGASVVKVAPVPRGAAVQITPPPHAYSGHRGTSRVQLDLKDDGGRGAFLRLAAKADVLLESFRPGAMAKLGLAYDDLRAVNPAIVYCSTTGFGQDGPVASYAGHDLDYQAVAGVLHCGERAPAGKPALPGATFADSAGGGLQAVAAILAALVRRGTTGEGAYLDVSITEGTLWLTSLYVDEYLATGEEPGPGHNVLTGRYACYDTYRCADGEWVAVAAIEARFFANLCRLLGCEEWADRQHDDDAQADMRAAFAEAFATKPRIEWLHVLAPADTCVSPVWSIAELVDDPQFAARGVVVEAHHPTAGTFRQLAPLFAGMERRRSYELPDATATRTAELLAHAGLGADEIEVLQERGAIA
jgi:alpha-methylacyl-CoA racemase